MAHDVKLDVLTFQIKKHGKDTFLNFDEIPDTSSEDVSTTITFTDLFTKYIESFNGQFQKQVKTGKAIALSKGNVRFSPKERTVTGLMEGGTTGIGRSIKGFDNVDETVFTVSIDHVESIPFYFMLWFPIDSNLGIAIVQSLGDKSITNVFQHHFKQFVRSLLDNKSNLIINNHIPESIVQSVKKKGTVNTIMLRRLHLPSDKAEKLLGLKYQYNDITIEIKITGLKGIKGYKDQVLKYVKGESTALFDTSSLEDIGIDGEHDTIVKFEHNGKVATGKSSNGFNLSPSYYVNDNDIKRDTNFHPTYSSLNEYCKSFLAVIKKEIKYKPVKT